jgi:hypothetical protein
LIHRALALSGNAFVVLATLTVHTAGGFEDVLGVEAFKAPVSRTCSTECSGIIIHSAACGTGSGLFWALYINHTTQRPGREPDKNLKDCTSRWKISSMAILPKHSTIGRDSTWTFAPPGSRIGKAPGLPCTMTHVKKQDFYELVERALEELPPELASSWTTWR